MPAMPSLTATVGLLNFTHVVMVQFWIPICNELVLSMVRIPYCVLPLNERALPIFPAVKMGPLTSDNGLAPDESDAVAPLASSSLYQLTGFDVEVGVGVGLADAAGVGVGDEVP